MNFKRKLSSAVLLSVLAMGVLPGVSEAAEFTNIVINTTGNHEINGTGYVANLSSPTIKVENTYGGTTSINFTSNATVGIQSIGEGMSFLETKDVNIFGADLMLFDSSSSWGAEGTNHDYGSIYTKTAENVIFNNNVDITADKHHAIVNEGSKLTFNGNLSISSDPSFNGAIIKNESDLVINSPVFVVTPAGESTIIENTNSASKLYIGSNAAPEDTKQILWGNIKNNGELEMHIKGENSMFTGKIDGNASPWNNQIYIEDGAKMIPTGYANYNLHLSGGSLYLHQSPLDSDYKSFSPWSLSTDPNKESHIYINTDLANSKGDHIHVESGLIENATIHIRDKQMYGGPVGNGNVTVLQVCQNVDNYFDLLSEIGYGGTYTTWTNNIIKFDGAYYDVNNNLYKPKIETVEVLTHGSEDGTMGTLGLDFKFVGWQPDSNYNGGSRETEKNVSRDESDVNCKDTLTTLKRLNDIRTDPAEVGVWIRGEKGKNKIRSYSYDYNLMSGGYDWHTDNEARNLFYGFGLTYSTNKCDDGVVGDSKSLGYNIYGSWLGKKHNDYVDLILKYGKLKKNYAGIDKFSAAVSGEYDKDLFVISTKYGRRFYKDNGFYIEPQVGYAYGKVGSADYTQKQENGPDLAVHADATNSHIISFDLQVGKNIKGTELYTRLGYVYDLDGKINVSAPGVQETDDMGGGYVRWTVGASRKVGKNNSFYCDIEKDFGSKVKKPYAVSLGYRHTF